MCYEETTEAVEPEVVEEEDQERDPNDPQVEAAVREFRDLVAAGDAPPEFNLAAVDTLILMATTGEVTWAAALANIGHEIETWMARQQEPAEEELAAGQLVGAALYNPATGQVIEIPLDQLEGLDLDQLLQDQSNGFLDLPTG